MESTEERKTAWTPGPWITEEYGAYGENGPSAFRIATQPSERDEWGKNYFGTIAYTPDYSKQDAANANLIAAAPQLYEALEEAYNYTERIRAFLDAPERGGYELERHAHELQDKVSAALAAARGEAS